MVTGNLRIFPAVHKGRPRGEETPATLEFPVSLIGLEEVSALASHSHQEYLYSLTTLLKSCSSGGWKASRDRDGTTSLEDLLQCLDALMEGKIFLLSVLNHSYFHILLLFITLLPGTTVTRLAPSS